MRYTLVLLILTFNIFCFAQTKQEDEKNKLNHCGTIEYMNEMYKKYPKMKSKQEQIDFLLKDIKEGKNRIANYEDTTAIKRNELKLTLKK